MKKMQIKVTPKISESTVLFSRVACNGNVEPVFCLVNPSDNYQLIKKGAEIARVYQVDE